MDILELSQELESNSKKCQLSIDSNNWLATVSTLTYMSAITTKFLIEKIIILEKRIHKLEKKTNFQ